MMFTGFYDHTTRPTTRAPYPEGCDDVGQWGWELAELEKIVGLLDPQKILEIGTYHGGTLYNWLRLLAPNRGTAYTIDDRPPLGVWQEWVKYFGVTMENYVGNSHAADTLTWATARGPFDFLFIDGDHTYPGVKYDFLQYAPLVRRGGVVAFHDILNPAPGRNQDHIRVSILWQEIQRAGHLTRELVTHPDQGWGGIGVVYL